MLRPTVEFVKSLGKGSFGSVDLIKITDREDSSPPYFRAVKSSFTRDHDSLLKEFQILSKLRDCPRIIQTYGTSLSKGVNDDDVTVYKMSMEYAPGGSLASFMETRVLSDSMIRDFTSMILQGLASVHDLGYVHCDLKPENLLLFPRPCGTSYDVKIIDFGMSTKHLHESEFWARDSPFIGTPLYMSPDTVEDGLAVKGLDLWSLGCVVLEMYTGESPWPFEKSEELLRELLDWNTPHIPASLPWDARLFLNTCFQSYPKRRTSALELLNHPFLSKVSDQTRVRVTGAGGRRKSVVVLDSEDTTNKPSRVRIIPPKPPQFKKRPLRLKIIPPKPPASNLVFVQ